MLVTVEDGNLILELIKKSHNSDYNWSFAPHREGFKHHVVHIDEHGVNQVCISPSPDLSSASLLELVVNFGPDGVPNSNWEGVVTLLLCMLMAVLAMRC